MTWRRRREGRLINTYIRGAAGDREAEGEDTMRGQDDDRSSRTIEEEAGGSPAVVSISETGRRVSAKLEIFVYGRLVTFTCAFDGLLDIEHKYVRATMK